MKTIHTPLELVTLQQPCVEDDPEKQLSSIPLGASTSLLQMSGPLPSKPPQARLSDSVQHDPSSATQLSERTTMNPVTGSRSNPRRRRRRRVVRSSNMSTGADCGNVEENGVPGQYKDTFSPKSSHALRSEQIQRVLDPLIRPDSSSLLLCWGKEECCRIIPAQILDSADSTAQWNEAQSVWNQHNTKWRSWLPSYGVKSVTVVEVQIAGRTPQVKQFHKEPETFIGLYRPEQTKAEISRLEDMDPFSPISGFECLFDKSYGTWDHALECPSTCGEIGLGWTCPYEDDYRNREYLSRLQSRPFLHILFRYPSLAAEHESMDDQKLLIRHQRVLEKLDEQHNPNLGHLSFPGLLIKEGWLLPHPRLTLSLLASAVLFFSVVMTWLIYHDWAVAWQVGGCFLALITLVCGCVHLAL